jgi:Zn-finger nucleic acid-binding protein
MTEDVKVETTADVEQPVTNEVERKAAEQGWRPLDEWEGDPAEWRDARTFLDRGELLDRISSQSRKLKEVQTAMRSMEEHNRKLAEAAAKEQLDEYRARKKEALENNDAEAVVVLDEKIDEVKDTISELKTQKELPAASGEPHPQFVSWVERNSWYAQDAEMRDFADSVGHTFAKRNVGLEPAKVLEYVEKQVKRAYAEKFTNTQRERPSMVETGGGQRKQTVPKAKDDITLSEEETGVMRNLIRGGHITEEEYKKQLKFIKSRN